MTAVAPQDVCFLPAVELAARIRRKELSPVEVTEAFLRRIDKRNGVHNAYVTRLDERARAAARAAEQALVDGHPLGPLHGVPVAVKDLFDDLAGVRQTFGCKVFAEHVAATTQPYIARLEAAGAILLGKTNTPEFGHKGVTDNLLFGPTSTPFRTGFNAGGSSGGSAAAVADGLCSLAQGSDAGGSIRIPAACCGVVGLKATHGRIPGVYRPDGFLGTPFVHAGPLARTVADAALMLAVMMGPHDGDPYSAPLDGLDPLAACRRPIEGLRVAWSPALDVFPVDAQVRRVSEEAVLALRDAGAHVEAIELGMPASQEALCALWMDEMAVLYASVAANLKDVGVDLLGAHRGDLPPQLVAIFERGLQPSAVQAKRWDVLRTQVHDCIQSVFTRFDLLVCPTLSIAGFPNATDGCTTGPSEVDGVAVDPLLGWCLTYPFNYSGNPAASVPAGFTDDGLPVGLQLVGRRFDEAGVLAAAAALERVRPWSESYPPRAR